jgi:hypothetical protein
MDKRKWKLLDKIIVVSGLAFAAFMIVFWLFLKRSNKDYYLPRGFEGWVAVRYQVPGALPLPEKGGVLQVSVSSRGLAETSTPLDEGWGRDRFFWVGAEDTVQIPSAEKVDGDFYLYLHAHSYQFYSHESLLKTLPEGADTLLWDGTKITMKDGGEVSYQPGEKTLEYFYISEKPQPIRFVPPENPSREYLKSLEDYRLRK